MTVQTADAASAADGALARTGSRTTRLLGALVILGTVLVGVLGLVLTEPDAVQLDTVRILYVHVPVAIGTYLAVVVAAIASVAVLVKGSMWWDVTAAASAEIAVVLAGLTLVTGSIWGRPTWNTWWEWGDVKLMTTLVLFLMLLGYLAYRQSIADPAVRAKRSAVIALIASLNLILVNRSVDWWANRTLHQASTLREGRMEDLTLFTLALALTVFCLFFAWLLIHRFRAGWLEYQADSIGFEVALGERRAQAAADVNATVDHPGVAASGPGSSTPVREDSR